MCSFGLMWTSIGDHYDKLAVPEEVCILLAKGEQQGRCISNQYGEFVFVLQPCIDEEAPYRYTCISKYIYIYIYIYPAVTPPCATTPHQAKAITSAAPSRRCLASTTKCSTSMPTCK